MMPDPGGAVPTGALATNGQQSLFAGYAELDVIDQIQRIGSTMPLTQPLREWFQSLAKEGENHRPIALRCRPQGAGTTPDEFGRAITLAERLSCWQGGFYGHHG